uniref:Uncharacterized protein n=1 Tax=Tanacetum cinerariifolium TaxID=118510 RepID=A0A699S1N3_TANCI|nr:hypothetical protein [Tanacetum cinerariifolium]
MSPSDRSWFLVKTGRKDDDAAATLVDEFAKGLTNVLPSTISFGLSSSTSCEEIGIFVAREDEFFGIGTVSAIVVDAVDD